MNDGINDQAFPQVFPQGVSDANVGARVPDETAKVPYPKAKYEGESFQGLDDEVQEQLDDAPPTGSLRERVDARREQLAKQTTTILDVPGYVGILAAEYRHLTWRTIRKIQNNHSRVSDPGLQEVRIGIDTLIMACETVIEVTPEGKKIPLNMRWGTAVAEHLGFDVTGLSERQAVLAIFEQDSRVIGHSIEYSQWQQEGQRSIDDEVSEDFGSTV